MVLDVLLYILIGTIIGGGLFCAYVAVRDLIDWVANEIHYAKRSALYRDTSAPETCPHFRQRWSSICDKRSYLLNLAEKEMAR